VAHEFGYSLANLQLGISQSVDGLKIAQIPLKDYNDSLELGLALADIDYMSSLTREFVDFAKSFFKN
jgi:hypothetical protein